MKRSLVVLSLVSLVLAGVASAEVKKGDVQIDFLGGWTQQNLANSDGHISVYFGAVRPGYALTDNIRVSGVAAAAKVTAMGTDTTIWALGASAEYVFMPTNILNPYIGGEIAWASADTDAVGGGNADGLLFAPRGGVLFTLNPTNNLFAEYQYQMYTGDLADVVQNGNMILLGIEHKFKAGQ
jgi:hypothetical protein